MQTYHYITHPTFPFHNVKGSFAAESDSAALDKLRAKYGEHLVNVMVVFTKEGNRDRIIWKE